MYTDGSDRFFGTMTSALLALRHDVDRDGSQEHQTLDGLHDCGIDTHDGQTLVDDAHHEGADNSTGDGADATGYRSTANEAGRDASISNSIPACAVAEASLESMHTAATADRKPI